jgi:hypothetical protein
MSKFTLLLFLMINTSLHASPILCDQAQGYYVSEVRGHLIDESNNSLARSMAGYCLTTSKGKSLCLRPKFTNDQGQFLVSIADAYQCVKDAAIRFVHLGSTKASMFCPVKPNGSTSGDFTKGITLFDTVLAHNIPSRTSDDNTYQVNFDHGLKLTVTPSTFSEGADLYDELSLRFISPTEAPNFCFLNKSEDPSDYLGFFGFYPETDIENDGAIIELENNYNLNSGQEVELWVLGSIHCSLPAGGKIHEGHWDVVGVGTVNLDATKISFPTNVKLPCLNWMGLKLKK